MAPRRDAKPGGRSRNPREEQARMKSSTATTNGHVDSLPPIGLTPEAAERKHARRLNARAVAGVVCVLAAFGGALRTGDLVTVLATTDKSKPTAQTRAVLDHVVVDQVGQADTLAASGSSATANSAAPSLPLRPSRPVAWVTLLVPEDRANSLSLARWTGDLELIQLPAEETTGQATP